MQPIADGFVVATPAAYRMTQIVGRRLTTSGRTTPQELGVASPP
ncbi:MAG TPA: hypothetical protein VL979_00905 [Solirubrobacteraceae bacterium]|nr:hypothetical protein [Solirubrobacteraceae bacterium]